MLKIIDLNLQKSLSEFLDFHTNESKKFDLTLLNSIVKDLKTKTYLENFGNFIFILELKEKTPIIDFREFILLHQKIQNCFQNESIFPDTILKIDGLNSFLKSAIHSK